MLHWKTSKHVLSIAMLLIHSIQLTGLCCWYTLSSLQGACSAHCCTAYMYLWIKCTESVTKKYRYTTSCSCPGTQGIGVQKFGPARQENFQTTSPSLCRSSCTSSATVCYCWVQTKCDGKKKVDFCFNYFSNKSLTGIINRRISHTCVYIQEITNIESVQYNSI